MKPEDIICELMLAPNSKKIYVLGCFDKRITIYSQQIKAINLAWALFKTGRITKNSHIGVVGAGVSGITMAVALARLQCNVLIFEKKSDILSFQQGNHTRYVHPNIYDWPNGQCDVENTILPFLNWSAGSPDEIYKSIRLQWNTIAELYPNSLKIFMDTKMVTCLETDAAVKVEFKKNDGMRKSKKFDFLIYAGGFGTERGLDNGLKVIPYWDDDDLHQLSKTDEVKKVAIFGCGDGGLVDYLRASLKDFNDGRYIYEFSRESNVIDIGREMEIIDSELSHDPTLNDPALGDQEREEQQGQKLYEAYKKRLKIPKELIEKIEAKVRTDTKVHVFITTTFPFRLNTSRLNRLLVFILYDELEKNKSDFRQLHPKYTDLVRYGFMIYPRIGTNKVVYEDLNIDVDPVLTTSIANKLAELRIGEEKFWKHDDHLFSLRPAPSDTRQDNDNILTIDYNENSYDTADINCSIGEEEIYLSFPNIQATTLPDQEDYASSDVVTEGFDKETIDLLRSHIETQREAGAEKFVLSQQQAIRPLHNAKKLGIFSFQINERKNSLHFLFYRTDYFTHIVQRLVYKDLAARTGYFNNYKADEFHANFRKYNFLNTSFGLYILVEVNQGLVVLKRSQVVSNPEEAKWHVSVDKGLNPTYFNARDVMKNFSLLSLHQELGLGKDIIDRYKRDNIKFYDLFMDTKRYEIVLTGYLPLGMDFNELKRYYGNSRGGKGYETTDIKCIPLKKEDIESCIANNNDHTDALRYCLERIMVRKGLLN